MAMYGIDISEHNGDINLTPYKGQFVIIRAGYGQTHEDKKFKRNVDECRRLGIPFGIYWYSYALNTAQAREEARKCLSLIAPYKAHIKVGVWFDMEDADGYKKKHGFSFSRSIISALCNEFCEIVQKAGYYVGIYASQSWMNTYISCPKYDKWVANWGSNNGKINVDTSAYGTLLQYTSRPLDKNYMYADISRYSGKSEPVGSWKKDATGWWYQFPDGSFPASKWLELDAWYWFDEHGYAFQNRWLKHGDKWYYFDDNCRMVTGWKKVKGWWYYMDKSGAMLKGWQKIKDKWYYLNEGGGDRPEGACVNP